MKEFICLKTTQKKSHNYWNTDGGRYVAADVFASYKQGDMPWGDSLVERPE